MWKITENSKKTSEIIAEFRKHFPVWVYNEENVDKEFPVPKKTTRYFAENVEADEELKNLSADDLKEKGIEGITLREHLLLELQYFQETGKHLDKINITLCSGSRYSDGGVPLVGWNDDELSVYWYYSYYRYDFLRSRRAVSLEPSSPNPLAPESLELKIGKETITYDRRK